MTLEQAFFILEHGSSEGEDKYFEAVKTIKENCQPVVRCENCKHLRVWNRKDIYAFCPKTSIAFLPFERDTRTFFCSFGERKPSADG